MEEPCLICLLTKATKTPSVPTTDISKFPPGFMLQMDFVFFNVEIIREFTSTFVAICSTTSYLFGLPSRSKRQTLDILKFLVTTLSNQDKNFSFIRFDEDRAIARSSGFMKTCHNMNITVQTTSGYASSINGKRKIPNNTLANITREILLNSSLKKELCFFAYQYSIWLSCQNNNRLRGDVPYFLWNGTRPSCKHIKIWGVRVYIINEHATRNNLDNRSHRG